MPANATTNDSVSAEISREHLLSILQNTVDGVIITDRDGAIRFHNAAAASLFGYQDDTLIGREIRELIPDDLGVEEHYQHGLELPHNMVLAFAGPTFETKGLHRDGKSLIVELTITATTKHGERSFAAVIRDASKRLQAERLRAQLAQSQKLESVGQLAAGIAHEINTPSQYIGDNLSFLQESFAELLTLLQELTEPAEDAAARLQELRDKCDEIDLIYLANEIPAATEQALEGNAQITHIVAAMKSFCHPGLQERGPVDLNKAIQNTLSVSRAEWKSVAEIDQRLDEDMPFVTCNENEIKQVLLNLIVNAAHALEEVGDRKPGSLGSIRISTRIVEDWAEVEIADNGPGIPPHIQSRVFDPFFTTKRVGKGTGQGLAMAWATIVESHKGELLLTSQPDQGTSFTIRLPTRPDGQA